MSLRVALYEDNDTLREGLAALLRLSPGFSLVGAYANGAHVLENTLSEPPDVVLMDIQMPGRSGIECVTLLRAQYPQLPVMMLTVYDDPPRVFEALREGAMGYLLKKTPPDELLAAIQELTEGGAPMSASVARLVLQHFRQPADPTPGTEPLSDRERDVLHRLVEGDSYKMIADRCNISMGTVRSHICRIYQKLHVNSKSEAVAKALKSNLFR